MILHGRQVIITTGTGANSVGGGTVLAMMKSCDIDVKCDEHETCSTTDGSSRTYRAGRMSWTINSNHLVEYVYSNVLKVGTTVLLQFRNKSNDRDAMYGNAIITEFKINATVGNLCVGTFRFRGTGPLTSLMS